MENIEKLENVQLASQSKTYVCRVDLLSKKRKTFLKLLFAFSLVIILLSFYSGLHSPLHKRHEFYREDAISPVRKAIITLSDISAFNRDFKVDMYLQRNKKLMSLNTTNVTISLLTREYYSSNRADETYRYNDALFSFVFPENQTQSMKVNIFNISALFACDTFELQVFLKFPLTEKYSGYFEVQFDRKSFSIFTIFIRSLFFIGSVFCYFNLVSYEKKDVEYPQVVKLLLLWDILLIIDSNPLYCLKFLTDSFFIPIIQSIFDLFFTLSVLYLVYLLAKQREKTGNDQDIEAQSFSLTGVVFNNWRIIPSIITFVILTIYLCFFEKQQNNTIFALSAFSIIFPFLISIYAVKNFKTDNSQERMTFLVLFCLYLFGKIIVFQLAFIEKQTYYKKLEIFFFMINGIFTFFINYLYWPTKSSDVELDLDYH